MARKNEDVVPAVHLRGLVCLLARTQESEREVALTGELDGESVLTTDGSSIVIAFVEYNGVAERFT
jgi:hypothetical protein